MYSFSSEIFIIGINPYVPVPEDIILGLLTELKKKSGPIPVNGKLNNKPFTQTIVKFSGMWRLYLNGPMRKSAGIDVGDVAHLEITLDTRKRTETIPPELAVLLQNDRIADAAFTTLPPYRQKEIVRYINNLKTEQTRTRTIQKVIRHLHGEKSDLIVLSYERNKK